MIQISQMNQTNQKLFAFLSRFSLAVLLEFYSNVPYFARLLNEPDNQIGVIP